MNRATYLLKRLRLLGLVLFALVPKGALAESSVLLIVHGSNDQDTAPYELRLRSELATEGLEVVTTTSRTPQNLSDLEGLARRTGAIAGLAVFVDLQGADADLWVGNPYSSNNIVRSVHAARTETDAVSVFALRVVEALRGARLEIEQQKRHPLPAAGGGDLGNTSAIDADSREAAQKAQPSVRVPERQNPSGEEAEASAAALVSRPAAGRHLEKSWLVLASAVVGHEANDVGAVMGPGLEVRHNVHAKIALGLALMGPLFASLSPMPDSRVRIDQEIAEIQARWALLKPSSLSIELLGATGISRFAVKGEARAPGRGVSTQGYGWTASAGVGVGYQLSSSLLIGVDLQWMRRLPAPVVIDEESGGSRRLTGDQDSLLLAKLGLGLAF